MLKNSFILYPKKNIKFIVSKQIPLYIIYIYIYNQKHTNTVFVLYHYVITNCN